MEWRPCIHAVVSCTCSDGAKPIALACTLSSGHFSLITARPIERSSSYAPSPYFLSLIFSKKCHHLVCLNTSVKIPSSKSPGTFVIVMNVGRTHRFADFYLITSLLDCRMGIWEAYDPAREATETSESTRKNPTRARSRTC